jgi:hypothetical protein
MAFQIVFLADGEHQALQEYMSRIDFREHPAQAFKVNQTRAAKIKAINRSEFLNCHQNAIFQHENSAAMASSLEKII